MSVQVSDLTPQETFPPSPGQPPPPPERARATHRGFSRLNKSSCHLLSSGHLRMCETNGAVMCATSFNNYRVEVRWKREITRLCSTGKQAD
ncbi:hypothetical protein ILYODFUR_003760 [Ilyodon furcidens]|uniref:Uncharacterized protein n=1 Tax=Ilyodon furcidens TaxID=33524 RepID=A0ABV0TRZ5_9TELE